MTNTINIMRSTTQENELQLKINNHTTGTLTWDGNSLHFDGQLDESARIFLNTVNELSGKNNKEPEQERGPLLRDLDELVYSDKKINMIFAPRRSGKSKLLAELAEGFSYGFWINVYGYSPINQEIRSVLSDYAYVKTMFRGHQDINRQNDWEHILLIDEIPDYAAFEDTIRTIDDEEFEKIFIVSSGVYGLMLYLYLKKQQNSSEEKKYYLSAYGVDDLMGNSSEIIDDVSNNLSDFYKEMEFPNHLTNFLKRI